MPSNRETNPHLWKPGQSGNPAGRPTGSVSLKTTLLQLLTPERAKKIVDAMMKKAESGDMKAVMLTAELLGEIGKNAPTLALQINNQMSDDVLLERARRYVGIIDVTASPVTASALLPVTSSYVDAPTETLLWEEKSQISNQPSASLM